MLLVGAKMGFLDFLKSKFSSKTVKHYDRHAIELLVDENKKSGAPIDIREADMTGIDLSQLDLNGVHCNLPLINRFESYYLDGGG